MRALVLAVVVSLVVGCGGDPAETAPPPVVDPLLGTWELVTASGCADGLVLAVGAQYERNFACALAAGGVGLDVETGTYTTAGGGITFTADQATCADAQKVKHFGLAMPRPTELDVIASDGLLAYQKVTPSTSSGAFTFGCWMADGLFYAMPLAPIP